MSSADHESSANSSMPDREHDPYAALRHRDFRLFLAGNMLSIVGIQMQTFAVTWEIYEKTRSNLALAWVGLVQVVPVVLLFLPAGHLVDRFDRRRILMLGLVFVAVSSLGLAANSALEGDVGWSYLCLFLIGTGRSLLQPARSALLPLIVPRELFSNAVTWNSGGFQLAMVVGPALGGLLVAALGGATAVYVLNALLALLYFGFVATIRSRPFVPSTEPPSLRSLAAGLSFVWRTKVILGAITLDMFAVLLGGATALLPVYAKEILFIDATRLGWMRAAPGIGALCMSFLLAHRPPMERAGRALLWSVAGFGVATILFGLSTSLPISLVMLFSLGALDMISVVIRHTLVQLQTPDAMRGRVSAVNGMFIGVSNELGEFESGLVAALCEHPTDRGFGPMVSVVSGGMGTLLVVAGVAAIWPELRRYGRLDGPRTTG
ncbi:MAG: MFS transporter [Planctomycetales bacterium]